MQQFHWQERFSIGVEIVDEAHRQLFSIVEKILELYIQKHEDKFACVEGIKYFKAYAIRHFAQEEAYMREIGYDGYLPHKRIHDRMKRETLPALERELYATDFSTEAVQHFIGVCTGWLTGHIIIEDRAITGRAALSGVPLRLDDERSVVRGIILYPLQEMFGTEVEFVGPFSKEDSVVDAQYYQLLYAGREGQTLCFILVIGERLLLRAASLMFGMDFYEKNEIVRFAMQEIVQNLMQRAAARLGKDPDAYQFQEDSFLERESFQAFLEAHSPEHSLLFRVRQDNFALCIHELPAAG